MPIETKPRSVGRRSSILPPNEPTTPPEKGWSLSRAVGWEIDWKMSNDSIYNATEWVPMVCVYCRVSMFTRKEEANKNDKNGEAPSEGHSQKESTALASK